jgi:hypothetical protein
VSTTTLAPPSARDAARRLDAVDARHLEVHEHDVRLVPRRQRDRLLAVGGERDDLDTGRRGEQAAEAGAHDLVVVGDQHADREGLRGLHRTIRPHRAARRDRVLARLRHV